MSNTIKLAVKAKKSLLSNALIMLVSCTLLQIFISMRGSHLDTTSQLLLGCIALYYFYYHIKSADLLSKIRFGRLVAHLSGFLIINCSYHIHAFFLFIGDSPAIKGSDGFSIDPAWFGALFGMTTFWGIGLLMHLIASIASRGYEDLPRS